MSHLLCVCAARYLPLRRGLRALCLQYFHGRASLHLRVCVRFVPEFVFVCVCVCVCVCVLTSPALSSSIPPSRVCVIYRALIVRSGPSHSAPRPAYQHCVTLTTANYHRDGDLGFTVALREYRYVSFNKLPSTDTHRAHTQLGACPQPSRLAFAAL